MRKLLGRLTVVLLFTHLGASTTLAQSDPGEAARRRAVVPYIRALTSCVAHIAATDTEAVSAYHDGTLATYLRRQLERCPNQMSSLLDEYDQIYGEGEGAEFIRGPYTADLERAVLSRIKGSLDDKVEALRQQNFQEAKQVVEDRERAQQQAQAEAEEHRQQQIRLQAEADAKALGVQDLKTITDAYKANEMRFVRDYKGKLFLGKLPFSSARQSIASNETFRVYLGSGSFTSDIDCAFSTPADVARMSDWNPGDMISVRGTIADVTLGSVELDSCTMDRIQQN